MDEPQDIKMIPYASIQQVDQNAPLITHLAYKRRTKWEKLGLYNVWVLILGTIVVLAAIGFLAFLWIVSIRQGSASLILNHNTSDHPPRLWTLILRQDWTSRAVTLATVLIRVALAAQLAIFAALMAALILERVGASTEDLPLLSMIRCANTGPQALIWNIIHTVPKGQQLGFSLVIMITIINALTLQFMSTILLADFDTQWVVLGDTQEKIPWAVNETSVFQEVAGSDFWRSSQTSYPSFAEYKQDSSQGANFVDTGLTYRGFLPFVNASQRQNLRHYTGPMTIVDERVICVKPKLSSAIYQQPPDSKNTLSANIDFNDIHPDVTQLDSPFSKKFNCSMPWRPIESPDYWHASLCRLQYNNGKLHQGMMSESDERRYNETNVWLVFNVTGPVHANWTGLAVGDNDTIRLPLTQLDSSDGPWAKIGASNMTISVSACLLNPQPEVYVVEASGTRNTRPYDNKLDWDPKQGRYGTRSLRWMLAAIGAAEMESMESELPANYSRGWLGTDEARGVMSLQPVADWSAVKAEKKYDAHYHRVIHGSLEKIKPWNYKGDINDTFVLTPNADRPDAIHMKNMWIAQDILKQTQNPAVALQALSHIVLQTAYYDWFESYDLKADTTYSMLKPRSIPSTYRRFLGVSCLLALHFVLLAQALFLFLTKTNMSLLGNAWQAVAQVSSTDTAAAVQHGTTATDREVLHAAKRSGLADSRVMIRESQRGCVADCIELWIARWRLLGCIMVRTGKPAYENWIRLWDPDEPWKEPDFGKMLEDISPRLYYAVLSGVGEKVKLLLDAGAHAKS